MSMILDKVNYIYGQGTAYEACALKDINLELKDGQFIGIIGAFFRPEELSGNQ